jgi:hypothetical protein
VSSTALADGLRRRRDVTATDLGEPILVEAGPVVVLDDGRPRAHVRADRITDAAVLVP